jgi:hypothetical protein
VASSALAGRLKSSHRRTDLEAVAKNGSERSARGRPLLMKMLGPTIHRSTVVLKA